MTKDHWAWPSSKNILRMKGITRMLVILHCLYNRELSLIMRGEGVNNKGWWWKNTCSDMGEGTNLNLSAISQTT